MPLAEFLEDQGYIVEEINPQIWRVSPLGGASIYIAAEEETLYFELILGGVGSLAQNARILYQLLDLNSEIAPAGIAINSTQEPAQLCLVGRLENRNLDSNELLGMLECLGLTCLRVQQLLD